MDNFKIDLTLISLADKYWKAQMEGDTITAEKILKEMDLMEGLKKK